MKKRVVLTVLILGLIVFVGSDLLAQCPMCRMSAESNLANGGTEGRGLNKGILYMLAMPYLIIATIGLVWYKNRKTEDVE